MLKPLVLLSIISVPLLYTGCEATYVDHHPRRTGYVERDVVVENRYPRRHGYVERDVVVENRYPQRHGYVERDVVVTKPYYRRPSTEVVVVKPRPAYEPRVEVRYYNDTRGRYYFKNGRKVYVNAGVYY